MDELAARYVGDGFLQGIPARDLTVAEWKNLSEEQRETAVASGLYVAATPVVPEAPIKKRKLAKSGSESQA